jgi:hypothetical protein
MAGTSTSSFARSTVDEERKFFDIETRWVDGRGKCPYSPNANSSALMTDTGDYFIGSATDFSSNDHAIYRMSGSDFSDLVSILSNFLFFVTETAAEKARMFVLATSPIACLIFTSKAKSLPKRGQPERRCT